jgi:hypothetical protein
MYKGSLPTSTGVRVLDAGHLLLLVHPILAKGWAFRVRDGYVTCRHIFVGT